MALENILSQEIIQKLGWTLLHFIWQAAAAALLLGILLAVLRKSSANLRYIVACAALGLIVLLPIATMQIIQVSSPQPTANIEPAPVILPAKEIREIPAVEMTIPERPLQHEKAGTAYKASWQQHAVDRLETALPYLVAGWLIGVFGLSLWNLGGWAQLQRLRKKLVKQVDDSIQNRLCRLSERLHVKQAVQLLESTLVQVPTVVGWLRPVILLPASALTGLTTEQLEALLAHELAHIRRYDYLINMLQTVAETLGFYHPAVWWVSHKIRLERENCCDDLAVSISGDRICYARALTSMEEIRAGRSELAVAATGGNLFGRIRRLVDKDSTESSRTSWIPSVITILLIAIIAIPTTLALTANDKTPQSAQFLLDKMLEHRSRVKNLQYVAEDNIWQDLAAEQAMIEDQIKSMRESGISEQQLERFRQSRTEAPESSYQILRCTIDDEERVKIEQTGGTYDSSGKKVIRGDKYIWAWNGILGTELHQSSGLPASATIRDIPQMATRLGHPWKSFTGIFCGLLEEAIAAEIPVSVEKLEGDTCRIAFDYKTRRIAAIINPSQGYTCPLQEYYNEQGRLTSRSTIKYEKVTGGIWFPVSGQIEDYSPNGTVRYRSIAKLSQIRINDPDFNAGYFDVDMPEGTAVRDEVQGKKYVVGSKRVYDLDESQKPSAETEEIDPNSWQEKFYSLYRLEDGQVLKRIAPPFIPERTAYLKSIQAGRYSPNTPPQLVSQYFNWDGKLSIKGARVGSDIPRLNSILESVIGLGNREYDIPSDILSADMSGDWTVRKDTPQEELLQALEQIIKDETSRDIDFVKQKVESEVIIARGKYDFKPLSDVKEKDSVHIYVDKVDAYSGAGGGSGTLGKFLQWVGNRIGMNIIDETEAEDVELSWRNHDSSELSRLNHDTEPYNQRLDLLLKNLNQQTGLTFERKTATVEKWFISVNGTINAPQKADAASVPEGVILTPTTTDTENKTQQEQLNEILKKFSDKTTEDKSGNNSKSVRESVENYIAAALAGNDEKAAEYAYPGTAVAAQTKDIREILQGQNIKIVGSCIGEWNSLAISSVIQADHGRTGSIVFHLKKVISDQKVNWLIDDIDIETLDTIGNQISYFLNNVPDAKMIIINPDTYTTKQTDVPVESDNSGEGRQGQTPARNDPILAKSSALSAENKSIVKVDLSVVEVPFDSKMDRETTVEIKNLIGGKIAIPDSPAAADLLRKAAEATVAVKDESAGDKRMTQEQFDTLVDMLVSRGYVKILINPTLEVVDGQMATIMTNDDSIEITPSIQKDGNLDLQANITLSMESEVREEERTPIVSKRAISTRIRMGSGQSWIVEGMKDAEKSSGTQEQKSELLVILTPAIVSSAEPKEPMETVNFQNAEAATVIEKLAEWTGKTIIPTDELMKQKITIQSPQKLPRSEAAAMIFNALRSKGYTVEQDDETIFLKPVTKEQPSTDKDKIMIDTKILTVSDEFLKDIGLDANSISDPNAWQGPKPITFWSSDSFKTYNLVLDNLNVAFLFKAAQNHQGTEMLAAPRVAVWDGETAKIDVSTEFNYTSGYSEPNRPANEPKPKVDLARLGNFLTVKPQLTPDKKNIHLDFELEIRELRGIEERKYKEKYPYQIPEIAILTTTTSCLIPDGETLLNGGRKITHELESTSRIPILGGLPVVGGLFRSSSKITETRTLLILVKPSFDPQIKAPP